MTTSWPLTRAGGQCCEVTLWPRSDSNPGLSISKPSLGTRARAPARVRSGCPARAAAGSTAPPTFPTGSAGRTCLGEARRPAAHRKAGGGFARWGGAGPGRDHWARGGARPRHPEPDRIPRPFAPLRTPSRPRPAAAVMGACLGACSLLSCVSPSPAPAARRRPLLSCFLPPNSFSLCLPPNLSFWIRTPPPRPGSPCPSVSLPCPPPTPALAPGYGDSCSPGLGLPRGRGGARRGGGGECSPRAPPGTGETEARGWGGAGCCGPTAPDSETSSRRAFRGLCPGRSDSVCPNRPLALSALGPLSLCSLSLGLSAPARRPPFVHSYLSAICLGPFVCPTVFVRLWLLQLSLSTVQSLSVCPPVQCALVSAHSVWLKLTPGTPPRRPAPPLWAPERDGEWAGSPCLPF